jgi:K+-sensing histidine kinase KdpD
MRVLRGSRRRSTLLIVALGAPVLVSVLLIPLRSRLAVTPAALVLVVVIVALAAYGERESGIIASVASSASVDFFLSPPYERFAIFNRSDIETAILLAVIGVIVSELAVRGRRQNALARQRAGWLAMLHDFAEMVATGETAEFVVIRAAAELTGLLHLRDCRFEEQRGASRQMPRLEPGGEVFVQGTRWDVRQFGLPGREVELLVESRGRNEGRFLLVPTPGEPITLDRLVVAVALAGQVGAALGGAEFNG